MLGDWKSCDDEYVTSQLEPVNLVNTPFAGLAWPVESNCPGITTSCWMGDPLAPNAVPMLCSPSGYTVEKAGAGSIDSGELEAMAAALVAAAATGAGAAGAPGRWYIGSPQ